MKRASRFPLTLLLVLIALAVGGIVWMEGRAPPPQAGPPRPTPPQQLARTSPPAVAPLPTSAPTVPVATPPAGRGTSQQAYRFAVRGGKISLEGVDLLQGDFHKRRGPQVWLPGMWCVRFLDANLRVLAQETAAAPDEPCVVLDPYVPTAGGTPQASKLKLTDDVMMQMRVPPLSGASWIKIYRIAGTNPAAWDVEPMGQLLASIPLPQ